MHNQLLQHCKLSNSLLLGFCILESYNDQIKLLAYQKINYGKIEQPCFPDINMWWDSHICPNLTPPSSNKCVIQQPQASSEGRMGVVRPDGNWCKHQIQIKTISVIQRNAAETPEHKYPHINHQIKNGINWAVICQKNLCYLFRLWGPLRFGNPLDSPDLPILRGLVGDFIPAFTPVLMKWANNSVCWSKNSNLFFLSLSWLSWNAAAPSPPAFFPLGGAFNCSAG